MKLMKKIIGGEGNQSSEAMEDNGNNIESNKKWMIMEDGHHEDDVEAETSTSMEESESSSLESSTNSIGSSSSDMAEDASSSSTSSNGPLYELSQLMADLPIKRGLSKHYEGKSESFTCLASVKSLEDLAKRVKSYNNKKFKCSKSYGRNLDAHPHYKYSYTPKAVISKRSASRTSILSSIGKRHSLLDDGSSRLSVISHKNF